MWCCHVRWRAKAQIRALLAVAKTGVGRKTKPRPIWAGLGGARSLSLPAPNFFSKYARWWKFETRRCESQASTCSEPKRPTYLNPSKISGGEWWGPSDLNRQPHLRFMFLPRKQNSLSKNCRKNPLQSHIKRVVGSVIFAKRVHARLSHLGCDLINFGRASTLGLPRRASGFYMVRFVVQSI